MLKDFIAILGLIQLGLHIVAVFSFLNPGLWTTRSCCGQPMIWNGLSAGHPLCFLNFSPVSRRWVAYRMTRNVEVHSDAVQESSVPGITSLAVTL